MHTSKAVVASPAFLVRWEDGLAFLIVLLNQLLCFLAVQLDELYVVKGRALLWQCEVSYNRYKSFSGMVRA